MSKMVQCKECKKEIPSSAEICPECGHSTSNFFIRHKIYSAVVVIILLVVFAASGNNSPKKAGEANNVSTTEKDTNTTSDKTFMVGDTVELDNFRVTVNKVYVVNGDQYTKPREGNEYLAVDCTVENISKEEQSVSSVIMFKVVDQDGRQCDYSLLGQTAANAGQLDGRIAANNKLTGVYVVEVPKEKTGLELQFNGSLMSQGQITVKLN